MVGKKAGAISIDVAFVNSLLFFTTIGKRRGGEMSTGLNEESNS